jgi:iron(III) transport system ATP-binding protein
MSILQLENVRKSFCKGAICVANRVDLAIEAGEIFTILGESGCGKSTLLRMIAGFEEPDGGTVSLAGEVLSGAGLFLPPEKRRVGMVFQNYALFPHMSVAQNVAFGLKGLSRSKQAERVEEVLALTGLQGYKARYPHELSGGQQQRIALARALAPGVGLLLLDEPFSSLDLNLRIQMRKELRRIIKASGTSAIFVTHDQQDAFEISDRIAVMNGGAIEQVGPPKALYYTPATRYVANFLGKSNLIEGRVTPEGIETPLGHFALACPYSNAQAVTLLIRPEIAHLSEESGDVEAVVTGSVFQGEHQEVHLMAGQTPLVVYAHGAHTYEAGVTLWVHFDRHLIGVCERLH